MTTSFALVSAIFSLAAPLPTSVTRIACVADPVLVCPFDRIVFPASDSSDTAGTHAVISMQMVVATIGGGCTVTVAQHPCTAATANAVISAFATRKVPRALCC